MATIAMNGLSDVVDADLCAGCGICQAIEGSNNVKVEIDDEGFYRPIILRKDSNHWSEVRKICPGIFVEQDTNTSKNFGYRTWGPIASAKIGYAKDPEFRWIGSSGGALSALLAYLIESNAADFVIHSVPSKKDPLDAQSNVSKSRKEILSGAGSRYAPVAPLKNIDQIIKETEGRFVFVGKPCDIAALRGYTRLHTNLIERLVMAISFFCAGTPSLKGTYELIEQLGLKSGDIQEIRYRGHGWPGSFSVRDISDNEYSKSYTESWGKVLNKHLQYRCKICPDGIGELADIAFGDAWHTSSGLPDFTDRPGWSLIIARTENGNEHVNGATSAGYIFTEDFDVGTIGQIQPYQLHRRQAILSRLLAMKLLLRSTPSYHGFHLIRNAIDGGAWFFVKQFVGAIKRLFQ